MTSMNTKAGSQQVAYAGVDTHKATHYAAVIDGDGQDLADCEFPTTQAGCAALATWLQQWPITAVGIEQTGTYGAGLTRLLTTQGVTVMEVNTPDPTVRAKSGKSDYIDAVMAAHAVRTRRAVCTPKDTSGIIESIRLLHLARRSAVKARTAALVQLGNLAVTAPTELRETLGTSSRQITNTALRLRPDPTRLHQPAQAAKHALRSLARRIKELDTEIADLDKNLTRLVNTTAPRLLQRPQVGITTAAQLLITVGQNINRLPTDAAFARLTGIAPIPASTGQTHRMRLHRGGDRQANAAIHRVAIGRLANYPPAINYITKRTSQGLTKKDAIRAMKRHIARELYGALKADLKHLDRL